MNDLGIVLIWCAIQVSLVTLFAAGLFFVFRRAGFAVGSRAPLIGLLIIIALPVLMFAPAPSWLAWSRPDSVMPSAPIDTMDSSGGASHTTAIGEVSGNEELSVQEQSLFSMFTRAFMDELSTTKAEAESSVVGLRWTGIVAIVFIAGSAIGLLHLAIGLVAMRLYRRRGCAIDDAELNHLLDELRTELNCRRAVQLRESSDLTTAATVGWLRPIILLPVGWAEWNQQERRTVLAHELAHICRHDYLACVCGQMSLAVHFYHPFVHWLVGQLRLEQELAADDLAATSSGGRKAYLTTLAEMALRQSEQRVSWAARAFLPTRTTFMRRIEMLRDNKSEFSSSRRSAFSRYAIVTALAIGALAVVGLRAPNTTFAQPSSDEEKGQPTLTLRDAEIVDRSLSLAYVPRDAAMVGAIRPAALLRRPELKPLAKAFQQGGGLTEQMGISMDRIEQYTMMYLVSGDERMEADYGGLILRVTTNDDARAFVKKIAPDAIKDTYDGQEYFKGESSRHYYFFADERTVVASEKEENLRRMIIAGKTGAAEASWAGVWNQLAKHDAAIQYNFMHIRAAINAEFTRPDAGGATAAGAFRAQFAMYSPLWNKADAAGIGVKMDERLELQAIADCKNADDAKQVLDTLSATIILGRNSLSMTRAAASQIGNSDGAMMLRTADIAEALLDKVKLSVRGDDLLVESDSTSDETVKLIVAMVPAATAAREAAQRAQSMNNMKQIALAFHNHADTYKTFPKSKHGDGKHPHSWRVAILPFIEQQELYDQYKFDEPWDSESNKKLLNKMPATYRNPKLPADTIFSSYYVLTGDSTIFDGKTRFQDITDGTSNTILTVEANHKIPWTKPEDIPYDPEKPLPKLGGFFDTGFNAGLADGSVRFMEKDTAEKLLRALFTAAGGEDVRDELRNR